MRACTQCGLSIGETATFCQVCGATCEPAAGVEAVATVEDAGGQTVAPAEPVVLPESMPPDTEPLADAAPDTGSVGEAATAEPESEAPPVEETELYGVSADAPDPPADVAADPAADPATEPAAGQPAEPAVEPAAEVDPEPAAEQGPATEAVDGPTAAPAAEPPAEQPVEAALDRRLLDVSALLQDAAECEGSDPARAASLLQQAIVECLDVTEDPLGHAAVRRDILESFDRLSALLERRGLADEALAVVDDAASLGLLTDGDAGRRHSAALRERRERLRRILFVDSAQL